MHPDRKIWPVATMLLVFAALTLYFARRIEQPDAVSAYLTLVCGAAAVITLAVAVVMLWLKRR